jgi:hypothetical protein
VIRLNADAIKTQIEELELQNAHYSAMLLKALMNGNGGKPIKVKMPTIKR